MIHPIVKYGDPVLETPTKRIEKFDDEIQKLVADMFESMYAAQGVGLAAPQIGIGLGSARKRAASRCPVSGGTLRVRSMSPCGRMMRPETNSRCAAKACWRAPSAT